MRIIEFLYLLYHSFVTFFKDLGEMASELKNPKAWSYLIIAAFVIAAYYRQYKLMIYLIPLMFLVKIIRDKIEGQYRRDLYQIEIKKEKVTALVQHHYDKYVKKCNYIKTEPLPLKEWKEKEIKCLRSNTEEEQKFSQS